MKSYRDPDFIRAHLASILGFYDGRVIDPAGGYFQNFNDDGSTFDPQHRHLVSSARMVFNYCKAHEIFGHAKYLDHAVHGFSFVEDAHWDGKLKSFNWILDGRDVVDATNHCYGLAFVMLASAAAMQAGIGSARQMLSNAESLLEEHLWDENAKLYADEALPDWSAVADYRGQNSNMHVTEAFIAVHEATGSSHYLDRAFELARRVTVDLAAKADGLIWEHYTKDLEIDWNYNQDDPKNTYRPWGFQPGHHTEWAKLLLILFSYRSEPWLVVRAKELVDRAFEHGWDEQYGGLFYGFGPDKLVCDSDKYFWVQSESIATLARLAIATGDAEYWKMYDELWLYADKNFIDHRHGAWFRLLRRDNTRYSRVKSLAGAKCDYHTIGACWDILRSSSKQC